MPQCAASFCITTHAGLMCAELIAYTVTGGADGFQRCIEDHRHVAGWQHWLRSDDVFARYEAVW